MIVLNRNEALLQLNRITTKEIKTMTNAQIIFTESVKLMDEGIIKGTGNLITVQDSEGNKKMIEEPEAIHTYAVWKSLGRQVKKGEKAKADLYIWKHVSKKEEMEVTYTDGTKGTEEIDNSKMFMKRSFFFTFAQTEAIAQ